MRKHRIYQHSALDPQLGFVYAWSLSQLLETLPELSRSDKTNIRKSFKAGETHHEILSKYIFIGFAQSDFKTGSYVIQLTDRETGISTAPLTADEASELSNEHRTVISKIAKAALIKGSQEELNENYFITTITKI